MRTAAFVAKLSDWMKWFFDAENKFIMLWENERRPLFAVFNCVNTKLSCPFSWCQMAKCIPWIFRVCVLCVRRQPRIVWWNWPTTKNTHNSNHSHSSHWFPFYQFTQQRRQWWIKVSNYVRSRKFIVEFRSSGCVCVCNAVHEWEFYEDVSVVMFI